MLVLRARLLVEAGFASKAILMLQSLAEFNFFAPANQDPSRAKEDFLKWWRRMDPLVGELGAKGEILFGVQLQTKVIKVGTGPDNPLNEAKRIRKIS